MNKKNMVGIEEINIQGNTNYSNYVPQPYEFVP